MPKGNRRVPIEGGGGVREVFSARFQYEMLDEMEASARAEGVALGEWIRRACRKRLDADARKAGLRTFNAAGGKVKLGDKPAVVSNRSKPRMVEPRLKKNK